MWLKRLVSWQHFSEVPAEIGKLSALSHLDLTIDYEYLVYPKFWGDVIKCAPLKALKSTACRQVDF